MTTSSMNAKATPDNKQYLEARKYIRAKEIWLRYYNLSVFQAGLISRDEYIQMNARIIKATAVPVSDVKARGDG